MCANYLELNQKKIQDAIANKKVSHARIARRLKVSTKTVQRWNNGETKRIRKDMLNDLAKYLSVDPTQLTCGDPDGIRIKPTNLLASFITSDKCFLCTQVNQDWPRYTKALRQVALEDLPNHQEVTILERLALAQMSSGALKAAKLTLKKAETKALTLGDLSKQLQIESWKANYECLLGNFKKAIEILDGAEAKYYSRSNARAQSIFYVSKGCSHLFYGKLEESEKFLRRGIALAYGPKTQDPIGPAFAYPFLGLAQLRLKHYDKAKKTFKKASDLSISGWFQGVVMPYFAIELIDAISAPNNTMESCVFDKTQRYFRKMKDLPSDNRYWQLSFSYSILMEDYQKAEEILSERKKIANTSPLFHAHFVLNSLLLARISQKAINLSPMNLKKTMTFFEKNLLIEELKSLKYLLIVPKIDRQEFFRHFRFF